jgi:Ca2+-binding EF-hand superfamily protein
MERNVRDKLQQRSFATSSPFQVRKSFKFFDTEKTGTLDEIGLTRALVFLGFEFSAKQIMALFARYDTTMIGTIDYMKFYKTCMEKNDDAPPIIPDVSHLGDDFELGSRPSTSVASEGSTMSSVQPSAMDTGYTGNDLLSLQKAEVKRIFSMLDKIGNDSISTDDFELIVLALNINPTPNELNEAKCEVDPSGSGLIYFEDFFTWWSCSSARARK